MLSLKWRIPLLRNWVKGRALTTTNEILMPTNSAEKLPCAGAPAKLVVCLFIACCCSCQSPTFPPITFPESDGTITVMRVIGVMPKVGPELFAEVSPRQLFRGVYRIFCYGDVSISMLTKELDGPYGSDNFPIAPLYSYMPDGPGSPVMREVLGPDAAASAALNEIMLHLTEGIEGGQWVPDPKWEWRCNPDRAPIIGTGMLCSIGVGLAYLNERGTAHQTRSAQGGDIELAVYHPSIGSSDEWNPHVFMVSNRTTEYLFVLEYDAGRALLAAYHKLIVRLEELKKRQD